MGKQGEIDYQAIGKRISYRRRKLGISQREVCERANLSDKYLSNIERATSKASLQVINRLAAVLDTSLDYLVNGIENKGMQKDINELSEFFSHCSEEQIDFLKAVVLVLKNR